MFSPLFSMCLPLFEEECVQMLVHTHVGLCVRPCVCSARLCSAAAMTRDSGSVCRELKPDVMQQESPSQRSQVPTAAREIILKRCVCVCVCMYILSVPGCVSLCICVDTPANTHQCFLQGLSAGTLLSSCRESNCFQLFYKLLGKRKNC